MKHITLALIALFIALGATNAPSTLCPTEDSTFCIWVQADVVMINLAERTPPIFIWRAP